MFEVRKPCCSRALVVMGSACVASMPWMWKLLQLQRSPHAPIPPSHPFLPELPRPLPPPDPEYVLESDLLPFGVNGTISLTPGILKEAWQFLVQQQRHAALRIVIWNGTMHFESPTIGADHAIILNFLKIHCYLGGLPDVDLIINAGDWGLVEKPLVLPVWSWTKEPLLHNDLLMPYWSALWLERTASAKEEMAASAVWRERDSKVIWRGSQTGFAYPKVAHWWKTWTSSNWRQAPRSRLVLACRNISEICDAAFHQVLQGVSGDVAQEIRNEGILKNPVDVAKVVPKPKYSLLVDGNGPSSSRSATEFGDGRATFWMMSPNIEFWYPSLKPYVHFIPVKPDASDIEEQLHWAMAHDSEVQAIANRSREFSQHFLRDLPLSRAFRDKLFAFAKLQSEHPATGGASKVKIIGDVAQYLHSYMAENANNFNIGGDVLHSGAVCLDQYILLGPAPPQPSSVPSPPVTVSSSLSSSNCHQEKRRLALLISGQKDRFMWQDTFSHAGDHRDILGCKAGDISCPVIADLYIVLKTGNSISTGASLLPEVPPYSEAGADEQQIVKYFREQGAKNVFVEFVSQNQLQEEREYVEKGVKEMLTVEYKTDIDTIWKRAWKVHQFGLRWLYHGNGVYMMQKAYMMALAEEARMPYRYTEFMWIREDTIFLKQDWPRPTRMCFPGSGSAFAIVDAWCGFGSYSDKIFFFNPEGAKAFWGSTWQAHIKNMATWIKFGLDAPPVVVPGPDPMQTEGFFQHQLDSNHVEVHKMDFGRVDSRYVGNPKIRCTPLIYSNCMAAELKNITQVCPSRW